MNSISRIARWTTPLALVLALAGSAVAQEGEEKEAKTDVRTEVALESLNDSGITGTAILTVAEEAVQPHAHAVQVNISGAAAGTYAAHIHNGTCETGGGVATALTAIEVAEGAEVASSTTTITPEQLAAADRPEAEARAKTETETETEGMVAAGMEAETEAPMRHGPLFVQVHLPDGTPAACGDLPMKGEGHGER